MQPGGILSTFYKPEERLPKTTLGGRKETPRCFHCCRNKVLGGAELRHRNSDPSDVKKLNREITKEWEELRDTNAKFGGIKIKICSRSCNDIVDTCMQIDPKNES